MDPTVIKRILIGTIIYLMVFDSLYGQTTSESNKMFQRNFAQKNKLDPFYYFGNKINKGNTHCYAILENDLVADVPVPTDVLCRNNTGLFAFKVNRMGKIEALEYFGDLDTVIVQKIKSNIRKTDGLFTRPTLKYKEQFHWFVLPFLSNGSLMEFQTCLNASKLENEYEFGFKQYSYYQNLRLLLPKFPFITILHDKDHHIEMLKKGMIKQDIM